MVCFKDKTCCLEMAVIFDQEAGYKNTAYSEIKIQYSNTELFYFVISYLSVIQMVSPDQCCVPENNVIDIVAIR